jgi:hypothetical protein
MTKEACAELLFAVGSLAFLAYLMAMLRYLYPALLFGSRPSASSEQRKQIVEEVRASGDSLGSKVVGGQVGGISINGPLMMVDIRPRGIIVTPLFGSSAVWSDQIKRLEYKRGFWRGGLYIEHTSHAIFSPIYLAGVAEDSVFARTLESIIPAASTTSAYRILS